MSLTPFACSVHTHSICCDGKNTLAEMARAAYGSGVRCFGASGHSHTNAPLDRGCVLPAEPAAYRAEVLRLREEYAGRMEVLLGIEQDHLADGPVPDWADYWIGSVHSLYDAPTGTYVCVDYDPEHLEEGCRQSFGGEYLALAEAYYRAVADMAGRKPVILGHIDLVTKFNEGGRFFDETAPRYRQAALEALHAADPQATLLEINTGAISRGWRKTPYPALFLLREWRTMGGSIILTADAHSADAIVYGYGQAARLAAAAGFTEAAVLTGRGPELCPLSVDSIENV